MNNFIFKSPKRLIKNDSINFEDLLLDLARHMEQIQKEQRLQRSDLHDISLKIQRLMIDKHLQMQVDEYFQEPPEDDSVEKDA